eukprot:CAMPEP_0204518002 /NCGR_PEP_ID=MMETSP0661-20131031/3974_1 /ASSEMBLY_ACC=CAM_ASM_000606 /TAXON_ID=109239 /ORGANISM="Alexandrium margalefi, Strain AMGDE01CS-322" /LENGTH=30 /DNA_ID= /DNA_START= /DNA_END= /DNA_ORIENTATION=
MKQQSSSSLRCQGAIKRPEDGEMGWPEGAI